MNLVPPFDDALALVEFASRDYWIGFGVLVFARAMDLASTWVASPNLVIEANPVARHLGWKWGPVMNLSLCFALAFWPHLTVWLATVSLLVAARNFHSAWLIRALGENRHAAMMTNLMRRSGGGLYLGCVAAEAAMAGLLGGALVWFGGLDSFGGAVGVGVLFYAAILLFFAGLGTVRTRMGM